MSKLTVAEQFVYDWQFNRLGSFSTHLANAIAKADVLNRALLASVYPAQVEGINNYQNTSGYWENILEKVGR